LAQNSEVFQKMLDQNGMLESQNVFLVWVKLIYR